MLTQAQLAEFEKNGFLKGSVVLNDDEVEELREELALVMEGKTVKKPVLNHNMLDGGSLYDDMKMTVTERVVQIVNIWMASEKFYQHAAHPIITEEISQLCSNTDTLRIWHDQIQYKPPVSGGPTGWHQDHPLWPIIQPADLVSAWVALDDAVIENGCMWMVPGSHKWGDHQKHLASTKDFKPYHKNPELLPEGAVVEAVPFEIKKGQVGYHHSLTWHGSPHNRSEMHRRAIAVHYMPGHTRYEPSANHPMHQFVNVKPGELMSGSHFPVVFGKAI
ncbi:phytanoyl-CoA dioxygenase family protein [Paenibacillus spongiae]|uniref:Phytanoyl-CoA dioxygenase family protein n=1 Tax=Paenibacillus spongiae TaxID=2909671 RepID=A0ABY5S603_9BACL|nr:phytanoyl-CoA dioxygenase family protein [Paenibacillus spongiae]UVI28913.1 phytanoyl-CoA dioxygenase family protein [Paenibacillus spongiae]